jgi:hypothetical protein
VEGADARRDAQALVDALLELVDGLAGIGDYDDVLRRDMLFLL